MSGIRYSDLEDIEAAVAMQVRTYERGCLATDIEDCRNNGHWSWNTRDITSRVFNKVSRFNGAFCVI